MFGKDWYQQKNKSKELTLGWLYNNQIRDDFANGYTKNMTDYWAMEMSFFHPDAFEADNIDTLLKKAYDAGFKKMLVLKQGTTILPGFQDNFTKFYEKNVSAKLVGHILDQQDDYYTMHPQAFFIDLIWWSEVGFPLWGDRENGSNNEFETIVPLRSEENWHDEYTPHWIKKGNQLKVYKNKREGWNIIKSAIESDITILSWNKEIRHSKHYSYPEIEYDGPRHLAGVTHGTSMHGLFFIANTEDVKSINHYIDQKKLINPEWNEKFDQVIAPAAGLSSLIYAFTLGVPKNGSLVIYDISAFALYVTQRIINEWDGKNYSTFAKNLIHSTCKEGADPMLYFRGINQLKETDTVIEKLNNQGFSDWIKNVLPTLRIDYEEMNMFNPHHHRDIVSSTLKEGTSYIHLTNVFHYMPTSFYYSLKQRYALQNELLGAFKKIENSNILLYSVCPVGHRSVTNWIDNIDHTLGFNDLPDGIKGKFLKWNKTKT